VHRLSLLVILFLPIALQAQQSPIQSTWDPLNFFVGHWHGTSKGEPGHGEGEHVYEFALGGKFLQLKHKATYPPQEKNPKGEIHEDLGLYSYDGHRKKFVFRQFHVEGFVNEYVEQEIAAYGKTLVFVSEKIENIPDGWRARETYKIVNQDEYAEVFELAKPQKDFQIYSESHWKRVK
jgi:hypothetical protein